MLYIYAIIERGSLDYSIFRITPRELPFGILYRFFKGGSHGSLYNFEQGASHGSRGVGMGAWGRENSLAPSMGALGAEAVDVGLFQLLLFLLLL